MKTASRIISLVALVAAYGCGTDLRNKEDKTDEQAKTESETSSKQSQNKVNTSLPTASSKEVVVDEELAGAQISDSVDDAISAIADEDQAGNASFGLVGSGSRAAGLKLSRECVESDGDAIVNLSLDFNREWSFAGPVRTASHKVSDIGSIKRTWSNANAPILCDAEKKRAAVDSTNLSGTQVDVVISRTKSRDVSFENKANKQSFSRSAKLEVAGKRMILWDSVVESGETYVASKTISSDVKRKLQVKNKAGEERIIESQIVVSNADPLKIEVTRSKSSNAASQKVIKSGTVEAQHSDKGKIVTHFENVVHTRKGLCMADSGMIKGEIYEAGVAEPALTFEIDLNAATKKIKFSNGKEFEYTPEGCDLETIDPMAEG